MRKPFRPGVIEPLSQSRYESMACPWLYATQHIEGVQQPPNEFALRGTEIHDVIKTYIEHLVAQKLHSDYEHFEKLLQEGWGHEAVTILMGMKESLIIDPEAVLGVEMYLSLDETFKFIEGEEATAAYEGTLDYAQVNGDTMEIWDWKSFWAIVKADTFQSKFYPMLAFCAFPHINRIVFHLQFVRFGVSRSVEYSRDDLPALAGMAQIARNRQLGLHRVNGLTDDLLEAMPGQHCGYCNKLMNGCPIDKINPYGNPSPEERVRWSIKNTAAKRQNDAILKDLVRARGPIRVEDANGEQYEAAFHETLSDVIPLEENYETLWNWDQAHPSDRLIPRCRIGATELKPYLKAKKRTSLKESIIVDRTPKTTFKITGIEDEDESGE